MTAIASLGAVSIDCDDPATLSRFYAALLDLEVAFEADGFVALGGAGVLMTFQRVDRHARPTWPADDVPKQIHLELGVVDLDAAEAATLALGATKAEAQPNPESWRVLIDPAGHPFCITTLVPAP